MECLLTTLKGVVDNDSLPKIGEIWMHVIPKTNNLGFAIGGDNIVATLSGDAYFTSGDSTTDNLGTSKTLTGSDYIYSPSMSEFDIMLVSKYNITNYGTSAHAVLYNLSARSNYQLNLDDLAFTSLVGVNSYGAHTGEVKSLLKNKSLNYFYLEGYIVYANSGITGNLSDFDGVSVGSTLTTFALNDTSIIGDIANLSLVTPKYFYLKRMSGIYGDLGTLPDTAIFMSCADSKNQNFTFTGFSATRQYILGLEGVVMTSGVDDFLIACAALAVSPLATDSFSKKIAITGTRTSASDTAVTTLQGKGFTIAITAPS